MKRYVREVFNCDECGYKWLSPWYEPTWLGKLQAVKDHKFAHDRLITMWSDWAAHYRMDEQERIIKLLDELDDEEWMGINQNFIALIRGDK